jgi:hypothetical protein
MLYTRSNETVAVFLVSSSYGLKPESFHFISNITTLGAHVQCMYNACTMHVLRMQPLNVIHIHIFKINTTWCAKLINLYQHSSTKAHNTISYRHYTDTQFFCAFL